MASGKEQLEGSCPPVDHVRFTGGGTKLSLPAMGSSSSRYASDPAEESSERPSHAASGTGADTTSPGAGSTTVSESRADGTRASETGISPGWAEAGATTRVPGVAPPGVHASEPDGRSRPAGSAAGVPTGGPADDLGNAVSEDEVAASSVRPPFSTGGSAVGEDVCTSEPPSSPRSAGTGATGREPSRPVRSAASAAGSEVARAVGAGELPRLADDGPGEEPTSSRSGPTSAPGAATWGIAAGTDAPAPASPAETSAGATGTGSSPTGLERCAGPVVDGAGTAAGGPGVAEPRTGGITAPAGDDVGTTVGGATTAALPPGGVPSERADLAVGVPPETDVGAALSGVAAAGGVAAAPRGAPTAPGAPAAAAVPGGAPADNGTAPGATVFDRPAPPGGASDGTGYADVVAGSAVTPAAVGAVTGGPEPDEDPFAPGAPDVPGVAAAMAPAGLLAETGVPAASASRFPPGSSGPAGTVLGETQVPGATVPADDGCPADAPFGTAGGMETGEPVAAADEPVPGPLARATFPGRGRGATAGAGGPRVR